MRMISLRYLVLAASLILLATEQSIAQTSLQKVRIAYSSSGSQLHRSISGQGEGLFSRRGIGAAAHSDELQHRDHR